MEKIRKAHSSAVADYGKDEIDAIALYLKPLTPYTRTLNKVNLIKEWQSFKNLSRNSLKSSSELEIFSHVLEDPIQISV